MRGRGRKRAENSRLNPEAREAGGAQKGPPHNGDSVQEKVSGWLGIEKDDINQIWASNSQKIQKLKDQVT